MGGGTVCVCRGCHDQRTAEQIFLSSMHNFSRLWLSQWGARPQLWVGQTRSISYVFLVDPKYGGRNKIACRIIKLWNNLINQPAKCQPIKCSQSDWLNFGLTGCTYVLGMIVCLAFVCQLLSFKLPSKNKHWKQQQQHAQKNCHPWQIQILNFSLTLHSESASSFYQNSKCAAGWWPFFYKDTKNCHLFSVITATALVI